MGRLLREEAVAGKETVQVEQASLTVARRVCPLLVFLSQLVFIMPSPALSIVSDCRITELKKPKKLSRLPFDFTTQERCREGGDLPRVTQLYPDSQCEDSTS